MIELRLNIDDFAHLAERLNSAVDQVPYALSRTMNDAVFETRRRLVQDTWPRSVTQRKANFPNAIIEVKRSTKTDLEVAIRAKNDRGHLAAHAYGGEKRAAKGNLAIPNKSWVRYTSSGVSKPMLPAAIIASTPKRALRILPQGIFVGEHGRLNLRYTFKKMATIKPDVPFERDFASSMSAEIDRIFPWRLAEAMASRR